MINFLFIRWLILLLITIILCCDASRYICDKNTVPCGCGHTNVKTQTRIMNGEDSLLQSWPMIVSLRNGRTPPEHICGGTILSKSYILTAAHCVNNIINSGKISNLTIAAGIHNLSEPNQIIRQVDKIIAHPLWQKLRREIPYDIAILHLTEPLDIRTNSSLSRTCLSPQQNTLEETMNYPSNDTRLIVIGWGTLELMGAVPDILQQVTINSIHHFNKICSNTIRDPTIQFCAGLYEGGKGPCHGDSGGPIFQWIGDRWEQVGIVSSGEEGCGRKDYPSIFTRLSYFYDWIQSHILDDNQTISFDNRTVNNRIMYQCNSNSGQCGCSRRNVVLSSSSTTTTLFERDEYAIPFSWSMIVSIRDTNTKQHICSGTILENSYILTTAHCLSNRSAQNLVITAGMYYLSESDVITRQVYRIHIHPNYTTYSNQYTNDIAILQLLLPLDAYDDKNISRTCVFAFNYQGRTDIQYPKNGTRLVITGWNITHTIKSFRSEILQQAEVYAMSGTNSNCSISSDQDQLQFCVGRFENNTDICYGGSFGDPIFQWINSQWIQIGLASYCSTSNGPGIFTHLTNYSNWIKSTLISSIAQSSKSYQCDREASCGCGQTDVNITTSGVTGSENAVEHSWPMIVSIQFTGIHWCGGSILSESFILTSWTCVGDLPGSVNDLTIVAGIYNISETVTIRRQVDQIYLHPKYTRALPELHDVAILHLDQPLPLVNTSSIFSQTCIPLESDIFPKGNSLLVEIAWNNIHTGENKSAILQQMSIELIDNEDISCSYMIDNHTYQFCVRSLNTERYIEILDLCENNVGGPVLMYINNHWEQIGIISDQHRCYHSNHIKVYSRISPYLEWIKNITNSSFTTYSSKVEWTENVTNWSSTIYPSYTRWIENVTNTMNATTTTTTFSNSNSSVCTQREANFILKILFIFICIVLS